MKSANSVILAVLVLSLSSCNLFQSEEAVETEPKKLELPAEASHVIEGSNAFGIELFGHVSAEEPKNLMISPLSAHVALSMLLNGAHKETEAQIKRVLGYEAETEIATVNRSYQSLVGQLLEADRKVTLAIANAVFHEQRFQVKPDFATALADGYGAQVGALDFRQPAAVHAINQWASDNTHGKIEKIMEKIDAEVVMILLNAVYFKGSWTTQFEKHKTTKAPFRLDDGNKTDADMMQGKIKTNGIISEPSFSAVELPYGRRNFAFVVIMPKGPLHEFMQTFDGTAWKSLTAELDLREEEVEVEVSMPKFTFGYDVTLNDPLIAMGMPDAFNDRLADLSRISDADLYVDFVNQNTYVDVNEEGTEAAAVTSVGIATRSGPPSITIDKPFIFAIRERTTNTLLFIGKVTDPTK